MLVTCKPDSVVCDCVANLFLRSCVYDHVSVNHESEINYYYYYYRVW